MEHPPKIPKRTVRYSVTVEGEVEVNALTETDANDQVKMMDVHTLLAGVIVDDPFESCTVEILDDEDGEDWDEPSYGDDDD